MPSRFGRRAVLLLALLLAGLIALIGHTLSREESRVFFAMDTRVTLKAYGFRAKAALREAEEYLRVLEGLFSVTEAESDTYAINHSAGSAVPLHRETWALLSFALDIAGRSAGAFDPTIYPVLRAWGFTTGDYHIPSGETLSSLLQHVDYRAVELQGETVRLPPGVQLDFGAVAKGYAADRLAELLRGRGIRSALIDLGGNVLTLGEKPGGSPWLVAIRDPGGQGYLGRLEARDLSVVTSGGYERYFTGEDGARYHHIIDPKTGRPAQSGLLSVTVVAPQSALCDALSTAIFVMGREKAEALWREYRDFEMLLLTEGGELFLTEGLEGRFRLHEDYAPTSFTVIYP